MVLITTVPILAMGVIARTYIRQNTIRMLEQASQSRAEMVAASAEAYLNSARSLVNNAADLLDSPARSNASDAGELLRSLTGAAPSVEAALLLDGNGIVRAASVPQGVTDPRGLDFSAHPGFMRAQDSSSLIWSPASRSPWSSRPTVALARRAGAFTVLAILSLDAMQAEIASYASEGMVITLVDQGRDDQGHGKTPFARLGGSAEAPALDVGRTPLLDATAPTTALLGFGDEERLVSVAPIVPSGWVAHVSQPAAVAYRPAHRADLLVLTLTCGAVVLVGVFAAMLASRLARPIESLGSAASAMARGGFTSALPMQPYDETESVAHTFREMASTIRQRGDELLALQRSLTFASSASRGEGFFSDVVGVLAMATSARCVIATEWISGGKPRARIIAAKTSVALQRDFMYELGGNPCQQVMVQEVVHIPAGVLREYSESPLMRLLGAEGYIAVALRLSDGTVAGHIAIIDDHDLRLQQHTRDLLLLLAARGGAELDRTRAERRLHELESLQKAVLQDQTEIICRTTIDSIITYANDAWCTWSGKRHEDLVGHSLMPMVHEEDRELIRSHFARLRPAYPTEVSEHRLFDAKGQACWVRWVTRVIADTKGRVLEYQITGHDITALKSAQAALADAEQRFRVLAENSSTVLLITDWATHSTLYASAAYEAVWGMAATTTGESPMSWTTAIHEEDRARVVRNFLLHAAESQFSECYRVVRPDGTVRNVRARAVALRERDGQVTRIATVVEDITESRTLAATSA